jgi:hypothetical protein
MLLYRTIEARAQVVAEREALDALAQIEETIR